jgi:branched-chain amino acid aminotransferase
MRKVWINGDIVDEHFAKLSIYDSALMFGDMVFEYSSSSGNTWSASIVQSSMFRYRSR